MTTANQKQIVADICDGLRNDLFKHLDAGRVPENWDGNELRQWISDYLEANYNYRSMLRFGRKRMKDYRNDVLINNLT
jgi:hypothetical protein